MTHKCIKCKAQYEDKDPDPYLCAVCQEARKRIVEKMEKEYVPRPKAKSSIQAYDEAVKVQGFPKASEFMI